MKRTFVGVVSAAFLASIIPLAGCDSGDTGVPEDTKPGVPLDTMKGMADMSAFKKDMANKKGAGEKAPSTPETNK